MFALKQKRLPLWLSLFLLSILFITPIPFLNQLQPDNSEDVFFHEDEPVILLEKELRQQFPEDDMLIILFTGDNLYADTFLTPFESVVTQLEKDPLIDRVIAITTMDKIFGTSDGFSVEYVLKKEEIQKLNTFQRKARVVNDRFAPKRIASTDGSHIAMLVRPNPLESSFDSEKIKTMTMDLISKYNLIPYIVATAGSIEIEVTMFDTMLADNLRFIPATVILGIVLIWWLFRSILIIVLVMISIGIAVNSSLLFVVLIDEPFSMPVSMVSPLLTSLTIAFFIHFFNAFLHASAIGHSGHSRILYALNDVERPIRFTAITTMAGLLSLGFSPLPPIQTFGYAAAVGVAMLYLLVIWIIPSVFLRYDNNSWQIQKVGMTQFNRIVMFGARISIRHAGIVSTVILSLLLLGGLTQAIKVRPETDLLLYFPQQHSLIQSDKLIQKNLAGTTPLEIIFDGKQRDDLKDPINLKQIKAIQQEIDNLPEVDASLSMADIVEEMHWAFHNENPAYRSIPDKRPIISQYLFIYDGTDLFELVDQEFKRTRMLLNLNVHGARKIRETMEKIEQLMKKNHISLQWQFAGSARMFSDQEKQLISGQLKSGAMAFLLIFLCLTLFWRSYKPAMLAMLPNISPILFIFITMGILSITLDIGTAIILSVAIGIAVDDTIHVYDAYLRRINKGIKPIIALMRAYRSAGRAISATTIILCGQFFILAFSSFIPTHQFGLMTGVGLLAALFFDILLLPAILALGIKYRQQKQFNESRK